MPRQRLVFHNNKPGLCEHGNIPFYGAAITAKAPRSERDALIAATALVHGMTVVTRNLADFAPTGVSLLNPWG